MQEKDLATNLPSLKCILLISKIITNKRSRRKKIEFFLTWGVSLFESRLPSAFARSGYKASLIFNDFCGQVVDKKQFLRLFKFWLFLIYKLVQFCKCLNFHFLFLRPLGFLKILNLNVPFMLFISQFKRSVYQNI